MKLKKIIFSSLLLSTFALLFSSKPITNRLKPITRNGEKIVFSKDYFLSFEKEINDSCYHAIAKKNISNELLNEYETVSIQDKDEYTIVYDLIANEINGLVELNVFFENTNERIVEKFYGLVMKNYNDKDDIVFSIDGNNIFFSEINTLSSIEQCSLFGNILHKSINESMKAATYLEPITKIIALTSGEIISLVNSYKSTSNNVKNYSHNSKKVQPKDFIYGQNAYTDWYFGTTTISNSGCGVIAGYNLAHALGRNISFSETIFMYEELGIEINSGLGYLGSNPYQISYFLKSQKIDYERICDSKKFKKKMEDNNNYYIILATWNGEAVSSGAHIIMMDKDGKYPIKYHGYNFMCNSTDEINKKVYMYNDYSHFFDGGIGNTFICAYFVKK